jgi:prophage regulatory protein
MNPLFLDLPALTESLAESRSSVYSKIGKGLFPALVKIGPRRVALPTSEAQAIAQARIAGLSDDEMRQLVTKLVASRKALNPSVGEVK